MLIRKLVQLGAILVVSAGVSVAGVSKTKTHHAKQSTAGHSKSVHATSRHYRRGRRGAWKRHGQQGVQPERATEIQQALIREKYLDGTPSGTWDNRTQQAMSRYQADNGWQSKVTPDSRALIKLGLGPNHAQDLVSFDSRTNAAPATPRTSGPANGIPDKR